MIIKEFIVLSKYDLIALCNDTPVEIYIDEKPFTLCSDEYFEKQLAEEGDE